MAAALRVGVVGLRKPLVVGGEVGLGLLLADEHVEGALKARILADEHIGFVQNAHGPLTHRGLGGGVGLRELHDRAVGEERGRHLLVNIRSSRKESWKATACERAESVNQSKERPAWNADVTILNGFGNQ